MRKNNWLRAGVATVAMAIAALALAPAGAAAPATGCRGGGGVSAAKTDICTPTPRARLLPNGMLIAPQSAPPRVKRVIAFANRIRNKPYLWGGGHGRWWDRGYDCSGAVSFALRGGGFLRSPLPSGPLASWGRPGKGRWITVYAHGGHTYMVVAGFRWDTSGNRDGTTGPSWHRNLRSPRGYAVRHPAGF